MAATPEVFHQEQTRLAAALLRRIRANRSKVLGGTQDKLTRAQASLEVNTLAALRQLFVRGESIDPQLLRNLVNSTNIFAGEPTAADLKLLADFPNEDLFVKDPTRSGRLIGREREAAVEAATVVESTTVPKTDENGLTEDERVQAARDELTAEFEATIKQIQDRTDEAAKIEANIELLDRAFEDATIRLQAFGAEQDALAQANVPGAAMTSLFSQRRPTNTALDPLPSAIGALLANQNVPISGNVLTEPNFVNSSTLQGSNAVFRDLISRLSQRDFNALESDPTLRAQFGAVGSVLGGDPSRALAIRKAASPQEPRIRSVLFG